MSYTLSIGQHAPNFNLKGTDEKKYTLESFSTIQGFILFFTCNHCPYVIGSNENTCALATQFSQIPFIAINSNSPHTYPEDSFEKMKTLMNQKKYPWTYLYDEDQSVAKAYGALKTPHFFLFNEKQKLIYTGRAVDFPRDATQSTTHELQDALEQFLSHQPIKVPITNPIGCNIKWEGKPAHWMPPEACDLV